MLGRVATAAVPAAEEIIASLAVKASQIKFAQSILQFLKRENPALRVLKTKQIYQVLRVQLATHTYALKNGQNREYFFSLFRNRNFSVTMPTVRGSCS